MRKAASQAAFQCFDLFEKLLSTQVFATKTNRSERTIVQI